MIELAEATAPMADYARQVEVEPVVVTANGRPIAALVSIAGADWETISLSLDPRFLAIIENARQRQVAEGGISSEEMRRRLTPSTTSRPRRPKGS
jgi:prevent-host-death family protein